MYDLFLLAAERIAKEADADDVRHKFVDRKRAEETYQLHADDEALSKGPSLAVARRLSLPALHIPNKDWAL